MSEEYRGAEPAGARVQLTAQESWGAESFDYDPDDMERADLNPTNSIVTYNQ